MTTATEATPNTVVVEETSPTTRRITITVPAETVDERIELSYGTLRSESALPGFRKGKAPRTLLEKRFGPTILKETRTQLVADAYSKAIEEKAIRPVTDPELAAESRDVELVRGKPFTFAVDVEVIPEFAIPELEGMEIKRPSIEVSTEHVDEEILRQRYRWGVPNRIDGPFENLDRMIGRAEVRIEGSDAAEPFFATDDAIAVVPAKEDEGKGQLLGLIVDGLEAALLGKKVGDTITITTTGPEHHEREEVRGKTLTITYSPRAAERVAPLDIPALVERFGLGTEEILREQIKFALEQRRDGEQAAAMREQVFEFLLDKVDFPLPAKLSEAQLGRTIQRQRVELLHRGLEAEVVERRLAELRGSSETQVRNRLKLFFVLARLSEQYGVTVTEQEIAGRVHQIAQSQGVRPDQVRQQLSQSGGLNELAIQIREHKAADRVVQKAKVTDVPADEWNKEVERRAQAGRPKGAAAKARL